MRPRPSDDPVMNTRAIAAPPYRAEQSGYARLAGGHLMQDTICGGREWPSRRSARGVGPSHVQG
jgi:hypothetical protein